MAGSFGTASQRCATFYVHLQTNNLIIIPVLAARNSAPDPFITPRHKIYAFTIFILLALLQIQSAGKTISPFEIHPLTTKASVLGILGYCVAFRACQCLPSYAAQLNIVMAVFGPFSLASLVTLFCPDSWWHIKYIFYVLLVLVELHQAIKILYSKYARRLILTRSSRRTNSATHLLPLTCMDLREHNAQLMEAPAASHLLPLHSHPNLLALSTMLLESLGG